MLLLSWLLVVEGFVYILTVMMTMVTFSGPTSSFPLKKKSRKRTMKTPRSRDLANMLLLYSMTFNCPKIPKQGC